MITFCSFTEAYGVFRQGRLPFRLLQDQAFVLWGMEGCEGRPLSDPQDLTEVDINWLSRQSIAGVSYRRSARLGII